MKKINIFLADGFEEIEGLTVVDLLRRAGIIVDTVSVTGDLIIHGAHGIDVRADRLFEDADKEADMIVLPGGMPGTKNLAQHSGVIHILKEFYENNRYIAAICAAPTIFGGLGFLDGRKATCYPSMEEGLGQAEAVTDQVVVDGHVITSRGLGTAIPFALKLIELLIGKEEAERIKESIVFS